VEQLVDEHPLHDFPLPPEGMRSSMLKSVFECETNLDMARLEIDLHLGHSASSSAREIERSCSNLMWHLGQIYSYIGILHTL
jgi:hypothetical protein